MPSSQVNIGIVPNIEMNYFIDDNAPKVDLVFTENDSVDTEIERFSSKKKSVNLIKLKINKKWYLNNIDLIFNDVKESLSFDSNFYLPNIINEDSIPEYIFFSRYISFRRSRNHVINENKKSNYLIISSIALTAASRSSVDLMGAGVNYYDKNLLYYFVLNTKNNKIVNTNLRSYSPFLITKSLKKYPNSRLLGLGISTHNKFEGYIYITFPFLKWVNFGFNPFHKSTDSSTLNPEFYFGIQNSVKYKVEIQPLLGLGVNSASNDYFYLMGFYFPISSHFGLNLTYQINNKFGSKTDYLDFRGYLTYGIHMDEIKGLFGLLF